MLAHFLKPLPNFRILSALCSPEDNTVRGLGAWTVESGCQQSLGCCLILVVLLLLLLTPLHFTLFFYVLGRRNTITSNQDPEFMGLKPWRGFITSPLTGSSAVEGFKPGWLSHLMTSLRPRFLPSFCQTAQSIQVTLMPVPLWS